MVRIIIIIIIIIIMVRDEWSTPPTVPPVQQQPNSQHGTELAVTALERQTVINSLSNATDRA